MTGDDDTNEEDDYRYRTHTNLLRIGGHHQSSSPPDQTLPYLVQSSSMVWLFSTHYLEAPGISTNPGGPGKPVTLRTQMAKPRVSGSPRGLSQQRREQCRQSVGLRDRPLPLPADSQIIQELSVHHGRKHLKSRPSVPRSPEKRQSCLEWLLFT